MLLRLKYANAQMKPTASSCNYKYLRNTKTHKQSTEIVIPAHSGGNAFN